ncbi:MAG TPA: hypothetical protein VHC22_30785 [Pirellulales bacterium]|nr:hypothetical protein [Pirellulales bacterium]
MTRRKRYECRGADVAFTHLMPLPLRVVLANRAFIGVMPIGVMPIGVMPIEMARRDRPLGVLRVAVRAPLAPHRMIVFRHVVVLVAGEQVQALSENRGRAIIRCHQQTRNR